jgi:hypothetical protein
LKVLPVEASHQFDPSRSVTLSPVRSDVEAFLSKAFEQLNILRK